MYSKSRIHFIFCYNVIIYEYEDGAAFKVIPGLAPKSRQPTKKSFVDRSTNADSVHRFEKVVGNFAFLLQTNSHLEPEINFNKHFLQSVLRMLGRRKGNL